MDSPASPLSRAGRTFWTVWNYFTEVVGRYLSPEPTNNDTSSRQEATAAQQTDDHRDGVKNELKETEVTFETGSEVKKPRPVVAWEQCNVIIGPGLGRENVQYTGQSNRGSDSKASQEGDDIKQEQVDRTENKDTIQHVTKEELNMGKGVQSVVVTGIQILFREPTSERSKGQGAQGHTDSYNCAEANRLRGAVAARKEEEEEIPEEVTEEFPCGEEGTKTEEHENNRDGEIHFDIESPNLTSACAEPATLLDKNGDTENKDRLMKHNVQSTEDETMVRLNEKEGEEETAVLFMETDKEGWKVAEIVEFSAGGENSDDDLCVIKDKMSRDGNEVKNGIDMEELRRKEEREEENRAIEEMDRREQEEILDRGFGPNNDFQVSENNKKHEYGDNRLKVDEGTIEKLDQENDPNPRLLCGGLSDEDRTLGRGQDIFVSEAELELPMAYDKRVFVSNDEITIVRDEQRKEGNIERIDSTVLEERKERVSEDGSKVFEDGGSNKIEDVAISIRTKTDTEAEDVKDKVTGLDTFFYQDRNVVVEKNKLQEEKLSEEDEDPLNEVEGKLISVVDNRVEIRGVAKYISPGLCEDLVVAQEPKRVACEETREEIPEINNGKELDENTAPKILEVGDDEVNTTHLQEAHTESDTKELEGVENTGTTFKSDNSPVSELMEGKEDPKTVERIFESEDIEKASDTVVDEHTVAKAAESLGETERTDSVLLNGTDTQILEDPAKTKTESHEPMEIELGLSEEAGETYVCLSDETLRTEAGVYKETEEIKAEFREGWMESKAGETVGTEFESVETQAETPEVRTGVVPSEDKDETESGSMQESADTSFGLLRETVEEGLQKVAEVDTPEVRTVTVLSMETNTEELVESEAGDMLETESGLVKKHEAEIPDARTETASSERTVTTEAAILDMKIEESPSEETESGLVDTEARIFLETTAIESELLEELSETESGSRKDKETKRQRIETEPSVERDVEELVESEAGVMVETEVGLVKKHEAEIPDARTETASSERTVTTEAGLSRNMTLYPSSIHTEAVFLTETKAVLSNESLETDNGLSDKSSEAGTKLQGMVEAGLPDSREVEAELFEEMVCGEVVLSQDTEDELSEEKYNIKATLMKELVEPGPGETLETEKGIMNETDAAVLDMKIEESPSEETESGIVDTEARIFLETTAIESELLEELSETESGSQKDKETKRQRIETEPSVERDVEELVESEAGDMVETEVGLVRTVAELPEEVRPKIELLEKTNRTGADSSEDTDETEARFSEEIETDLVETKYGLQKNTEEDILHVRTETVLSVETVEMDTDSSDKSLESRSLEISEAGLSEESVDSEAVLKDIYTEIPDVEKESGLSEETVDAGLSEKTDVSDTELVKNTKALIMLEPELSDATEAVLREKAEDNTANESLEIEVGLFWETDETEALVTEEVMKTGPVLSKQTDFGSQGQLLEIEDRIIEKSQVGWSEETVETDAGLPEENRGEGAKAGFRSPSGTKNVDQSLQLQFDASALDFTAQKSRIALKNPHVRPPRDPRTLLQMPSLTPSPSKPTVHVPVRGPTGIPMRGMGGIGIKLPGFGAGPPILRKTGMGVRGENNTENIPQKSELEQDVRDESPKKEEMQNKQEERKTKWTPPRHPGFGNPLMMNELKNKLKKTTKESGDD
ncbi:myosin-14 isoform X2 [Salvelinus namaycush]|uniref:Myosin-14 isoform X2 n=1 Tax=Salvelinus namaycush TaxID=8040 RepID=A0A8U1BS44_SALNM|nr:myosin-14 isoform X2 [Salvelinus namaycush]